MNKPSTFKNLTGIKTIKALYTSENELIKGTESEIVILFNTSVISEKEVLELLNTGRIETSDKVIIVPKHIAENLRDKE
jgi:hypothetical protein